MKKRKVEDQPEGTSRTCHKAEELNSTLKHWCDCCSFYRYLIEPELTFSEETQDVSGPMVYFDALPNKALLTLGMDPPESWLVESVHTPYDLDNIYLEDVCVSFF